MKFRFEGKLIDDYSIDGVDHRDYPDYCDAYIASASWENGIEFTDDELDRLNGSDDGLRYEMVWEHLH